MGDVYVNTMRTDEHGYIWMNSMTGALETDKNNYVYAGNTNPKYTLSWRNEFNWKGISLGFMLNARVGGIGAVSYTHLSFAFKETFNKDRSIVFGKFV